MLQKLCRLYFLFIHPNTVCMCFVTARHCWLMFSLWLLQTPRIVLQPIVLSLHLCSKSFLPTEDYRAAMSMNCSQFFSGHCSRLKRLFSILIQVQRTCSPSHMRIICKFTKHSRSSVIQLVGENTEKNPTDTYRTPLVNFSFWQSTTKNHCCSKNVSPVLHCSHKIFI